MILQHLHIENLQKLHTKVDRVEQGKLVPADSPRGLHVGGDQQDGAEQKQSSGHSPEKVRPVGSGEELGRHDAQHLLGQHSGVLCKQLDTYFSCLTLHLFITITFFLDRFIRHVNNIIT
jgi:hypothetical protein